MSRTSPSARCKRECLRLAIVFSILALSIEPARAQDDAPRAEPPLPAAPPAAPPKASDPPRAGSAEPEPRLDAAPDTWGSGERQQDRDLDARANDLPFLDEDPAHVADEVAAPTRGPNLRQRSSTDLAVRYTLENIELRGNTRTRARVVLRYLPFKAGDVIDVDDPEVELTRYRLLGTGFFRDVQFSLRKGSERGHVVLVIDVVERNTFVVNDFWMGLSADADTTGQANPLTPYAGLDVSEANLAGTGITLGAAAAVAHEQAALRVRFLDPAFLGGRWMTSGTLLFNYAKDFFGNAGVRWENLNELVDTPRSAVVRYTRSGGSLGVGRDLSITTQLWLHYRLESVQARVPTAATHERGGGCPPPSTDCEQQPIEFHILPGSSVLSTLRAGVQHDTRDAPFLPTRGWLASINGELALAPAGSSYDYQRLDVHASRWWELPWNQHVLRLELFGGAITGDAPFFEQYYVNDFSDFRPGRVLGLNFDRRPPPDLLDTSILEVRRGHYAGKLGLEYRIPLYRGQRAVYGIDLFASTGIYAVAGQRDLSDPPRGYAGAARVPLDLTANLGFRMDTSAGGFVFSFANALGFIPVLSGEDP